MCSESQEITHLTKENAELLRIISPERINTYLNVSGNDFERALSLYLWNSKIGQAFYLPIQSVEVSLRNQINIGLQAKFGDDWWKAKAFLCDATGQQISRIEDTLKQLNRKSIPVSTGQIVANLSLGFWVSTLQGKHNGSFWNYQTDVAFPYLPKDKKLKNLYFRANSMRELRNRISHHEPIFKRNLSQDFGFCMELLNWLCPIKTKWVRPHCEVSDLLRKKP